MSRGPEDDFDPSVNGLPDGELADLDETEAPVGCDHDYDILGDDESDDDD